MHVAHFIVTSTLWKLKHEQCHLSLSSDLTAWQPLCNGLPLCGALCMIANPCAGARDASPLWAASQQLLMSWQLLLSWHVQAAGLCGSSLRLLGHQVSVLCHLEPLQMGRRVF